MSQLVERRADKQSIIIQTDKKCLIRSKSKVKDQSFPVYQQVHFTKKKVLASRKDVL